MAAWRDARHSERPVLGVPQREPQLRAAGEQVNASDCARAEDAEVELLSRVDDQLALGVIAGLSRRGVRVPDDVSVVGCDDVPMAELVAPPLTTITMPTDEAGAAAVRLLDGEPTTVELSGSFVVRGSTGPVSAR